jgi:hypothetical protein
VITKDGTELDSKVSHVCPIPERHIFYELKNIQNDKWCYPIKTIFEKDNQEKYEKHFDNEFSFVRLGIPYLGWKPFKIGDPQDMKAHKKPCLEEVLRNDKHVFVTVVQKGHSKPKQKT